MKNLKLIGLVAFSVFAFVFSVWFVGIAFGAESWPAWRVGLLATGISLPLATGCVLAEVINDLY
jgi:branched-subunit amino acid permease